jgi:isocitrate dehydrogenase kinase/phosphatase
MVKQLTDSRLANLGAKAIQVAFATYQEQFKAITQRAKTRFENCQWYEAQADATERLDLYKKVLDVSVTEIHTLLAERVTDKLLWTGIKAVYSGALAERDDWEVAETFFNSVTRRIFTTVGLDPQIEFVDTDFETPPTQTEQTVFYSYPSASSLTNLLANILTDFPLNTYEDQKRDIELAAAEIEKQLQAKGLPPLLERAEIIKEIFYRRKGAYIVGRVWSGGRLLPLVLALLHKPAGIWIDAVLLDENEVGILFSFTRSYFHVQVERPYDLVRFLSSLMPRKRWAELYIAIGYNKHGKTLLYRNLLQHLATSSDQFEIARGVQGMVMLVFTLPSYDLVFKIIKDYFAAPKNTTRTDVMEHYNLVFQHDRAGRLIDAQEFEHLKFERARFAPALLEELRKFAAKTVTIEDHFVIIKHVYVERRVRPLNLYIYEADETLAQAAVVEMGHAIKDLAATNIFPGDMLLKNFGVTRNGRVVFYDYDELTALTNCNFRKLPEPQSFNDELLAEPWFSVAENDIFPEEFLHFLGLKDSLRTAFLAYHAELFEARYWREAQARLRRGEINDIFPYKQNRRLLHQTQNN